MTVMNITNSLTDKLTTERKNHLDLVPQKVTRGIIFIMCKISPVTSETTTYIGLTPSF